MQIGPYTLKNNLIVAPMAGVTDRPFRQLCKRLGAGMAVSEMVASNSLLYGSVKTRRRANHDGEVEPISVQIVGADPDMLVRVPNTMLITAHRLLISTWAVQQKNLQCNGRFGLTTR